MLTTAEAKVKSVTVVGSSIRSVTVTMRGVMFTTAEANTKSVVVGSNATLGADILWHWTITVDRLTGQEYVFRPSL